MTDDEADKTIIDNQENDELKEQLESLQLQIQQLQLQATAAEAIAKSERDMRLQMEEKTAAAENALLKLQEETNVATDTPDADDTQLTSTFLSKISTDKTPQPLAPISTETLHYANMQSPQPMSAAGKSLDTLHYANMRPLAPISTAGKSLETLHYANMQSPPTMSTAGKSLDTLHYANMQPPQPMSTAGKSDTLHYANMQPPQPMYTAGNSVENLHYANMQLPRTVSTAWKDAAGERPPTYVHATDRQSSQSTNAFGGAYQQLSQLPPLMATQVSSSLSSAVQFGKDTTCFARPQLSWPLNHSAQTYAPGLTSKQGVPFPSRIIDEPRGADDNSCEVYRQVQNRKIYDLPEYNGSPEDWPMFATALIESTRVYQYTNFENCMRLQRCLKGEAKETVAALLIHPDNVWDAYAQLQSRFGRHDLLIRSQIQKAREMAPIREDNIEYIIPFAIKVKNLAIFLRSAQGQHHLTNPTLMDELLGKLPMAQRIEWAQYSYPLQPNATVVDLSEWLTQKANYISLVVNIPSQVPQRRQPDPPRRNPTNRMLLHSSEVEPVSSQCVLCDQDHDIRKCERFLDSSVAERWIRAKQHRLCFCCLKQGHSVQHCQNKQICALEDCKRSHHELLHERALRIAKPELEVQGEDPRPKSEVILNCNDDFSLRSDVDVLFRILPVTLYGPSASVDTFALLDEGSSVSMLDESLIKQLGLQGQSTPLTLQWFKETKTTTEPSTRVDFDISEKGKSGSRWLFHGARSVKDLRLPVQTLKMDDLHPKYHHLKRLPIQSYTKAKPLLLIGLDNCHLGLPKKIFKCPLDGPMVAMTKLGWLVFGPTSSSKAAGPSRASSLLINNRTDETLEKVVSEYFTTENFGVKKPETSLESTADTRAREIVAATTTKTGDRYQSGLLWKSDELNLPSSFEMAKGRLLGIERKMKSDPDFGKAYNQIISEYLKKGYARKLDKAEVNTINPRTWYLPHFAVRNPNKPKKIRLVFDAAATTNGISLNSQLLKGPDEYQPLPSVLFNFRTHKIAVCADIKEMFHQVHIRPEDRSAQRFLWRWGDQSAPIEVFEMVAMTFGASCSPFIAQYIKNINALQYIENFPRAVESILHRHYVDDFVDNFATEDEAIKVSTDVRNIHKAAGFELRSFVSNSKRVVNALEGNCSTQDSVINLDKETEIATEKILGMYWETLDDVFTFKVNFHRVSLDVLSGKRRPSKRELLSIAMSIFDPFGLLANIMIFIKILLREVWRCQVAWDCPIPDGLHEKWLRWQMIVNEVGNLRVSRQYFQCTPMDIQLHIFTDASEDAFSAVAYWRSTSINGEICVSFVAGKTRCAPKQFMSIPRLELQSAVLGARLKKMILQHHAVEVTKTVFWSDSRTVIAWLRSEHRRYKPFVAHRVSEILDETNVLDWRWVPTKLNVADDATRAFLPLHFDPKSRWLYGPEFLKQKEDCWPQESSTIAHEDFQEELRPKFLLHTCTQPESMSRIEIAKFTNLYGLKLVVAYIQRFLKNFVAKFHHHTELTGGEITAPELDDAEVWLCRLVQQEVFSMEIDLLRREEAIPKSSSLFRLCPYLDEHDTLRVSGRLDLATSLPLSTRRPIILPKDHALTNLIAAYYHRKLHHQNEETIVNEIRRKFWIPHLRQVVRRTKTACMLCKLRMAKPCTPLMGQLLEDRVTPYVRPFTYSGVDYFGPLYVTIGRRREKRWVALFTCLTVRAIHLELATDLSTDAFILCLRNFVNRRGVPFKLRSDNGTNFVGADGELRTFRDVFDENRIQCEMTRQAIKWVFNCPANPSAGGAWERMVQSVKRVLSNTLKEEAPRLDTLQSLLIEAENIVNSRPLTHLPVEPDDEEPLTPNHFLIGTTNSTQTPGPEDWRIMCLRKQWRIVQQLKNRFWKRWMTEYLPTLIRRAKWCEKVRPLQVDDLVFICDADLPRSKWCKGRVIRVFCGQDGQVRSAELQTVNGVVHRPASKLALLDVRGESPVAEIHGVGDVAESDPLK